MTEQDDDGAEKVRALKAVLAARHPEPRADYPTGWTAHFKKSRNQR